MDCEITMKEIDLIEETDYTEETECTEIGHTVWIDHKTTMIMTIEGTIEMTTEMIIEMKIIETRYIRKNINTIIKTHMTMVIIELSMKTRAGAKIDTRAKTDAEMTTMKKLEVGPKKKSVHIMIENLKGCTKFANNE